MNTAALRARWETLAPREKVMVVTTTALVVLVLVWLRAATGPAEPAAQDAAWGAEEA